ncbi:MAG: hypothetical protein AW07_03757 [Candidatus Accumulibacter sp. SK-11]|nr:MAG: hypothetical protein AW07_03757 [Candidatus Accumulibacter sp. SK-11]
MRIGVQRDDVLHIRQDSRIADHEREARPAVGLHTTTQQGVQVRQLAAFALVTHPDVVVDVPPPCAVEEKEDVARGSAPTSTILLVQFVDPRPRQLQQRTILRQ